ncbi:hypothetical protein JL720_16092 [Aureococcus anophagefferens]|nr:hypothetical protein JL720_16092 [Aureococcus anophagefferens]
MIPAMLDDLFALLLDEPPLPALSGRRHRPDLYARGGGVSGEPAARDAWHLWACDDGDDVLPLEPPAKEEPPAEARERDWLRAALESAEYHKVGKNGVSPFQNMCAYLGGSAIQTVGDNPVAVSEANATFLKNPVGASLSGLWPRLIGVLLKRIPKFGFLLGYSFVVGEGDPGFAAATCASQCRRVGASICSAPFINPVRLVEKQQRAYFKTTGTEKPILEILSEAKAKNFAPLFRGTIPLMGHSLASAILGLVGQPKLQKYVQKELGATGAISGSATNLVPSAVVSPIYVFVTNPLSPALSRLEVIMQTNSIKGKAISPVEAVKEVAADMAKFGLSGVFRGQGIGIAKAVVSLTLFHEGRMFIAAKFKASNESKLA